ncbi:hypothetical protein A374_11565 [Fictibacillus macauensis ZFHKF-1]|uniref:Uncharacterized protein n=1 Tax=Fictibacillus macauensis ZFHKF-1 TaxID=1196324 RepID=I8AIS1_9BACL|nr:hypothetical protein [Fictibacillus macauensis]EIT85379.1 hypothetical protein A374_11565 [Fictibacillus macauensis ZFHKF-1]
MSDKEKVIAEYIESNNPSSSLDHALAFAYLKVTSQVTQKQYAEAVGVSDRAIRKYISDNKEEYEEEIESLEAGVEKPLDMSILSSRTLTEEQLDKFVDVLYKSAITGSARDRQLMIDFTGLTADDVMNLQSVKQKSLRWMIKGELSSISQYFDAKQLGVMIEESPYLYRGNKLSKGNANNFVQADVTDERFIREMAYFGMLFCSMYNQTGHPDTDVISQAVRLDRMEQGTAQALNKQEIKKYAEGKNIKSDVKQPLSNAELFNMYKELFGAEKAHEMLQESKQAKQVVKPAEIKPDVIKQRASVHKDALLVLTTVEEEIKHLLKIK